jgi:DNA-binding transcriptional MocR family regulator
MLKGQDAVVLLKLARAPSEWTVRSLASDLGIPHAGVHRSIARLADSALLDSERRRVNRSRAEEFLVHAVPYVFPPVFGGQTRGVRTAWAAHPLVEHLAPTDEVPPVWPFARGEDRGIALEPLHDAVPDIALRDRALWEDLALVDALRLGEARVRRLGADLLRQRLDRLPR